MREFAVLYVMMAMMMIVQDDIHVDFLLTALCMMFFVGHEVMPMCDSAMIISYMMILVLLVCVCICMYVCMYVMVCVVE